ncbi:radical SAM protein [Carboxylicivirga sp. M1479]|uniref:radical SAM protein n=1 Tax=Carboxylicivirga sp. M1479 TaxID=2594476 RepID=UPI0011782C8D|nr:radical SAM protein [Carboxylicivirga sp. M1479]TRX62388.1 radical SAM protein [Carboxylicivirga sp. M1479]
MSVFLFDKIVFGPVMSRRLGVSLGMNLMPVNRKVCSFDCIYCECGLNGQLGDKNSQIPSRSEVRDALCSKLKEMQVEGTKPDVITFAGNGEPTLHAEFKGVIEDTIELRNTYCPNARIAVLSNASRLHKPEVVEALKRIDDNIQKLDSGLKETIIRLDQPNYAFDLDKTIQQLADFNGQLVIQTMFVGGEKEGISIDNTTEADISSWLDALDKIKPQKIMIYTIERDTPYNSLKKIPLDQLKAIAKRAEERGYEVSVSG